LSRCHLLLLSGHLHHCHDSNPWCGIISEQHEPKKNRIGQQGALQHAAIHRVRAVKADACSLSCSAKFENELGLGFVCWRGPFGACAIKAMKCTPRWTSPGQRCPVGPRADSGCALRFQRPLEWSARLSHSGTLACSVGVGFCCGGSWGRFVKE
jgi:hypothetical protein